MAGSHTVHTDPRTLKETLTKLTLEIGMNWVVCLPFAMYIVRNSHQMKFTPLEIKFDTPPPAILRLQADFLAELHDKDLLNAMSGVQWARKEV